MPKNTILKNFGRRKSAGNILDGTPDSPTTDAPSSSFRVIDRPAKNIQSFDTADGRPSGKLSPTRPFNSPLRALRGKSVDDLGGNRWTSENPVEKLKQDRGSGGTTNSGSSGYYPSSSASPRLSSSSTLPSSVDADREEELFPVRKAPVAPMNLTMTAVDAPASNFASRAARAFSFGSQKNKSAQKSEDNIPPLPPLPNSRGNSSGRHSPQRDRGMTASSYASTAVPSKMENFCLADTSFGGDEGFGEMFASIGSLDRLSEGPTPPPAAARPDGVARKKPLPISKGADEEQDSEPMYPLRTHSRQGIRPTPIQTRDSRDDVRRFSWDGRRSDEELVSGSARESPSYLDDSGIARAFLAQSKTTDYSLVPERVSPGIDEGPKKEFGTNKPVDNTWTRKVELRNTHEPTFAKPSTVPQPRPGTLKQTGNKASRSRSGSSGSEDAPLWGPDSNEATPRAAKLAISSLYTNPNLFETSPTGPASRAVRPGAQNGATRRMTTAQFEKLRNRGDRSQEQSDDDTPVGDDEDEDEDDVVRAKKATMQRRKQEANMSIYRQQMKKVTGGGLTDLPTTRPPLDRQSSSAPSLHFGGIGGVPPTESVRGKSLDDDDEDIPLGVLQAHGFPGVGRPPTRTGENDLNHQRRTSGTGSVVGGGAGQGNLPPFARRLPMDPYYGSGIVSPLNRESLAFGGSGGSVYGGAQQLPPQGAHPGGLVGVIAGEERARAARRGSPNPTTGTFALPPMEPQVYHPQGAPIMPGMSGMPGMPMMPMMGGDPMQQQQQMQQFMQMQMQLFQQMMVMQQQQQQNMMPQQQGDFLQTPGRPMSMAPSFAGQNNGRAMTMMNHPPQWDAPGQQRNSHMPSGYSPSVNNMNMSGYTPSIAPSERSNVGMPSRYRPVSTVGDGSGRSQSLTSSMTLQAFTNQQTASDLRIAEDRRNTIRVVEKPKGAPTIRQRPIDPEDDEDEGWAEMSKKRSEKKFGWRKKTKTPNTQEESLSELYHNME
ncbi:Hypothetical protein R9X50_00654500 [Acrodontium crateriforme]|uniref:Uncharacterized protein n=1 Tax=Acrodontium crateriforme TaxID=150365 RepID=A0AAQ3MDC7_9PEZI|nr:Hypothetical protein R9X50_00654500 [Acrodontium crateriforme]